MAACCAPAVTVAASDSDSTSCQPSAALFVELAEWSGSERAMEWRDSTAERSRADGVDEGAECSQRSATDGQPNEGRAAAATDQSQPQVSGAADAVGDAGRDAAGTGSGGDSEHREGFAPVAALLISVAARLDGHQTLAVAPSTASPQNELDAAVVSSSVSMST